MDAPYVCERLDPRLSDEFYSLLEAYMGGRPEQVDPVFRPNYERWWRDHAGARAQWFRDDMVKRIEHRRSLQSLRVLDFGCGTGSSSLVFAERGATVVAIEPDTVSMQIARVRIRDCGVGGQVELVEVPYLSGGQEQLPLEAETFDLISLIGVMEHMLPAERAQCVHEIHRLLKPGSGELFLYDTPNRLFPYDHHTVNLWFSHWLPTGLARRYAIWRGRMSKDADYLRRGGVGVSRRTLDALLQRPRWRLTYEKRAEDVLAEFDYTARCVGWLGRRMPRVAGRLMRAMHTVLVLGCRPFGVPPAAWTMSHVLAYQKVS